MQFYILMQDYGKTGAVRGLEAVVQPELTRRAIVEQVRDIIGKGRSSIAFVKFVDGNFIEDITSDILSEATFEDDRTFNRPDAADAQAAAFDRARGYRNEVVG